MVILSLIVLYPGYKIVYVQFMTSDYETGSVFCRVLRCILLYPEKIVVDMIAHITTERDLLCAVYRGAKVGIQLKKASIKRINYTTISILV